MDTRRSITPEEVRQRIEAGEKLTIIDVREDEEVAFGMIPGAKHIVMHTIPDRLEEIPKDSEVILVCRSGNRSGRVYDYLEMHGYTKTVNMVGGMLHWED